MLTPVRGDAPGGEVPQVTLRLSRQALTQILAQRADFTDDSVELDGDTAVLATFHNLFEEPPSSFPIATP
ncbi:hypothetical protein OG856_35820 [Streptomyces sp. NBC_01594]